MSLIKNGRTRVLLDKVWSKSNFRNLKQIDYSVSAISTKEFLDRMGIEFINVRETDSFKKGQAMADSRGIGMGGGGNVELLAALTSSLRRGSVVVETGVSMGWSTKLILEYLAGGILVSSDLPYPGQDNEIGFLVDKELYKKWVLLLGLDSILIPALKAQITRASLIHYDSDKNYRGKLRSLSQIYQHMSSGSWLIVDDITDNSSFNEFCTRFNLQHDVVWFDNLRDENKKQYVGVIKKG